ncbi:MAG: hypothetical protein WB607_23005 [Candidatus Acidiferrum sp.]
MGDMALMANGDVIVSDGEGGGVYRLLAQGSVLERLDDGDFIFPQTPAMHPDGKHVFVPDYARDWCSGSCNEADVVAFDAATVCPQRHRRAVFRSRKIDRGAEWDISQRVVVFTLDATLTRIESEAIIERSTGTLGDPTHGVVIDNEFYYIANSGWDSIDDHGNMKRGAKPSVPRIMRVRFQRI